MKILKLLIVSALVIFSAPFSNAQAPVKKESFKVYGNCGVCKKTIEASAKAAGVSYANWNTKTKQLSISYDPEVTNTAKVEEAIANSGYDTPDFNGSDSAYILLHECCKYERKQTANTKNN